MRSRWARELSQLHALLAESPPQEYNRLFELIAKVHAEIGASTISRVLPVGDTTPDVGVGEIWRAEDTGANTITNIDGLEDGDWVEIEFTNGNTTIQDNANVQLAGGANFVGSADDILALRKRGTVLREMYRSVN